MSIIGCRFVTGLFMLPALLLHSTRRPLQPIQLVAIFPAPAVPFSGSFTPTTSAATVVIKTPEPLTSVSLYNFFLAAVCLSSKSDKRSDCEHGRFQQPVTPGELAKTARRRSCRPL